MLKGIAAMASNRVIGNDGGLPWHLPEDLKWFKKLTLDHPIVMGRKTMESLGRALPRRRSVVVSRSLESAPEGYELVRSADEAVELLQEEEVVFVIGGARLFAEMLPLCEEVYLSFIFEPYEGDVRLPVFEDEFEATEILHRDDDFELRHYARK